LTILEKKVKKMTKAVVKRLTKEKLMCYYNPKQRYVKIAEDEPNGSTEGVNLSGDRKIGNCNRIALRRIP